MEIRKIEDLIEFVDKNYDKITDRQYCELVTKWMQLYDLGKPDTKEKTIDRLLDLYAFTQKYDSVTEMPLFPLDTI